MKTRSLAGRVFISLAVLLLLDALASVVLGGMELRHAGHAFDDVARALRRDDLEGAARGVLEARTAAAIADDLTSHPGFKVLSALPFVKEDTAAIAALAEVASVGSDAAARLVVTLDAIGVGADGVFSALYQNGAIDLEAVDELGVTSDEVSVSIAEARDLLEGHDPSIDLLERGLDRAIVRLDSLAESTERGSNVAHLLPTMVGRDEPRRYLLALQSPSEARGGGGLIGVYGVMSARGGRVTLDKVGPIEDLGPKVRPPVSPPDGFSDLYDGFSSLNDWRQANPSLLFPVTSEVLLALYERVRGERLDGVIAMDPIALGELTRGTGPLRADGWRKSITNNNARRLLLFQVYKHFVNRERIQNAYLNALVDELWSRVESGGLDAAGFVTGIDNAVARQHLKIYSADADEQALLAELGVTGDPRVVDGHLQSVFNNNNSGNKLDFFLRRAQSVSVELGADGSARVTTTVKMTNDVPKKGLRATARSGVNNRLTLGENRMSLHFMLPRGAQDSRYSIEGERSLAFRGVDGGFPVIWQVVVIRPEQVVETEVTYRLPEALELNEDGGRFEFTLWPQATARPDSYDLRVTAPPGYAFGGPDIGTDGVATVTGQLREPFTLSLRVIPEGARGR